MRMVIAHGHIFKNAGSTFDWSLRRNFADGFLDHRDDKAMREHGAAHLLALLRERTDLRAVSSHCLCRPLPQAQEFKIEPVYFLRHPLERIASVYAFERQQDADTPGAQAAREMSFRRYVAWRMQPDVARTIRDYQACNIAGKHESEPQREVNFRTLKGAIDNLWRVRCVGVVDRYDESMVAFEHTLRAYVADLDLAYIKQNVSAGPWIRRDFDGRVRDTLRRLGKMQVQVLANNSFDMALYRLANQKLDEAIKAVPEFEEKLADFRRRCRHLKEGGE